MKNQPDPQSPDEFVGSFSRSFSSSTPKTPFPFAPSALQSAELVKAVGGWFLGGKHFPKKTCPGKMGFFSEEDWREGKLESETC